MADDRARRLTTGVVAATLLLALTCFAAGLARGLPARSALAPLADLGPGLLRADGPALVGAGVLLLLLAPLLRLVGLIFEFARQGDRPALAAGLGTLALLALSCALAGR